MNRSMTIPGALLLLGTTVITAIGQTIMEDKELMDMLMYILTISSVVMALTWGEVEVYKRRTFSPEILQAISRPWKGKGLDPHARERNLVYDRAVNLGTIFHLLAGVIFLYMESATPKDYIVVGVFWVMYSRAIGVAVPWLFRVFFYYAKRCVRRRPGNGPDDFERSDHP
jgi:hypothetical protein